MDKLRELALNAPVGKLKVRRNRLGNYELLDHASISAAKIGGLFSGSEKKALAEYIAAACPERVLALLDELGFYLLEAFRANEAIIWETSGTPHEDARLLRSEYDKDAQRLLGMSLEELEAEDA